MTLSAFIKSLRGSDPDAALYWLARMVHAGEDPKFIFRRMLILACEDVGLADPHALSVAVSAAEAFDRVGLPEGRFHLAHAALYLASAPKSNSALGFFDALDYVASERDGEIPSRLKDPGRDKEAFGHGEGYLYPHAYRDHWVAQAYLPQVLKGKIFYNPGELGYEARVREDIFRRREEQIELSFGDEVQEVLTFTPRNREKEAWINRLSETKSAMLKDIRERVIEAASIKRHDRVLDANAGRGLLLWEAVRKAGEGLVWGLVQGAEDRDVLTHLAGRFREEERPVIYEKDIGGFEIPDEHSGLEFDAVIGRNIFTKRHDRALACTRIFTVLAEGGTVSLSEVIPSKAQRLSAFFPEGALSDEELEKWKRAEDFVYHAEGNILVNWDEDTIRSLLSGLGFSGITMKTVRYIEKRIIQASEFSSWLDTGRQGYGAVIFDRLGEKIFKKGSEILRAELSGKQKDWESSVLFVKAVKSSF